MAGPYVVVFSGMPLTGKSTLARMLASAMALPWIDVDEIRQEFFPNPERKLVPQNRETFIMTTAYAVQAARVLQLLNYGARGVILSGTFSRPEFKEPLHRLHSVLMDEKIEMRGFLLTASDGEVERRILVRQREGNVSNIDTIEKFRWAKGFFESIQFIRMVRIDTNKSISDCC